VERVVSWDALLIVASLIVFSGTAAFVSAYFTWRVCLLIGALEKRITRLEMLAERGAPGARASGGRG
jgi:hypothetical protein